MGDIDNSTGRENEKINVRRTSWDDIRFHNRKKFDSLGLTQSQT